MDAVKRLDALRIEGRGAARAADQRLDAAIPHLDWDVADVLIHLGGVHRRFSRCLRREVDEWPGPETVDPPADDPLSWYLESLAGLVDALGSVRLDDTFVTWAGDQDGHWILRRMANETAVHRWDIESASGPPEPLSPDLASDITEEFLTDIVDDRALAGVDDTAAHDGATLHLHATDVEAADAGEWFLTVTGDGLLVDRRHDKGDVALRGPASDLALWLYGRIPAGRLDAFGAPADVDWWSRAFLFD